MSAQPSAGATLLYSLQRELEAQALSFNGLYIAAERLSARLTPITQERQRSFYGISTAEAARNQAPHPDKSQRLSGITASFLRGASIRPRTAQYSRAFCWRVDLHAQAQAGGRERLSCLLQAGITGGALRKGASLNSNIKSSQRPNCLIVSHI